jgi:competence transcription factor ComK
MAFLKFPIYFSEDDADLKENLGLKSKRIEGEIIINTQQICAYNETDYGYIIVRMTNGECYQIPLKLKEFEDLLYKTEVLVTLQALKEN